MVNQLFLFIKKECVRKGIKWQDLKVRLEAHWVNGGNRIVPNKDKNASFLLTIPFAKSVIDEILSKENLSWCSKNTLPILHAFSIRALTS